LDHDQDAIVELGLIRAKDRQLMYNALEAEKRPYRVYLLNAPSDELWRRVSERNTHQGEIIAIHVSEDVFGMAYGMWMPPDEAERQGRDIRTVARQ
jgi:hypothetical protein